MCGCKKTRDVVETNDHYKKEVNFLDNKWIMDNHGRRLLVNSPIHDIYGDIIGYVTKNESGNTIRIFKKNIKQILD
jgi:hypothetical protein